MGVAYGAPVRRAIRIAFIGFKARLAVLLAAWLPSPWGRNQREFAVLPFVPAPCELAKAASAGVLPPAGGDALDGPRSGGKSAR